MGDTPTTTDAQSIIDAISSRTVPAVLEVKRGDVNAAGFVLIPAGMKPFNAKALLDEYRTAPDRREGTAHLTTIESFIAHTKRFADVDSVIFADPSQSSPSLVSVLDYHRAGADAAPRFGKHRAKYAFPLSDEWQAWTAANDRGMDQAAFAAFIEDRIADLADPAGALPSAVEAGKLLGVQFATPARVMELSRGLQVNVESKVGASVNLSTGEGSITFQEANTDATGAPLLIPGAFLVQLPVFRGDPVYQIAVRLRYRVQGGKITWRCVLYRTDRVFTSAFEFACNRVAKETALPVLRGTPEA